MTFVNLVNFFIRCVFQIFYVFKVQVMILVLLKYLELDYMNKLIHCFFFYIFQVLLNLLPPLPYSLHHPLPSPSTFSNSFSYCLLSRKQKNDINFNNIPQMFGLGSGILLWMFYLQLGVTM